MAGGGNVVIIGSNTRNSNEGAHVINHRLLVSASLTAPVAVTGPIEVEQDTHDDLNANVNLQVGDVDVSSSNPVPVEIVQVKSILSGSTNGRPIAVAATASPGTIIHTVPAGEKHQIFMVASNRSAVGRDLIVEWGGTSLSDEMKDIIPPLSQRIFSNGAIIEAGVSAIIIRAWCPVANIININGQVIEL